MAFWMGIQSYFSEFDSRSSLLCEYSPFSKEPLARWSETCCFSEKWTKMFFPTSEFLCSTSKYHLSISLIYCSTGQQPFAYAAAWDKSPKLDGVNKYQQMRIKFGKSYLFADVDSEANFKRQRDLFEAANCHRDTHYELSESFNIEGFVDATIASSQADPPAYLDTGLYVLLVLFLLELPFSFWMKKNCPKVEYTYVKTFRC